MFSFLEISCTSAYSSTENSNACAIFKKNVWLSNSAIHKARDARFKKSLLEGLGHSPFLTTTLSGLQSNRGELQLWYVLKNTQTITTTNRRLSSSPGEGRIQRLH
jgi:hypothetical protein